MVGRWGRFGDGMWLGGTPLDSFGGVSLHSSPRQSPRAAKIFRSEHRPKGRVATAVDKLEWAGVRAQRSI